MCFDMHVNSRMEHADTRKTQSILKLTSNSASKRVNEILIEFTAKIVRTNNLSKNQNLIVGETKIVGSWKMIIIIHIFSSWRKQRVMNEI